MTGKSALFFCTAVALPEDCVGCETRIHSCQDVWELDQDAVAARAEPVMCLQALHVSSTVVDGDGHWHGKEVLAVSTGAAGSGGKLNTSVLFALQFVLVLRDELQVPDIIQDDGIVRLPSGKTSKQSTLSSSGRLNKDRTHSVFSGWDGPWTRSTG